jgi:hypothetical protein
MEWYLALVLLLGTVCTAMFLGLPVAFAFFAANVLGTALFINGDIGLVLMPLEFHNAIKFSLAPIALFLLMGEILLQTGVAFKSIAQSIDSSSACPDVWRLFRLSAVLFFRRFPGRPLPIPPFLDRSCCRI